MLIKVITINLETDEIHSERVINFSNHAAQSWFMRNAFWALHNKHCVEIININDEEPAE